MSFEFDIARWFRFLVLDLITAPINYKWQEFLETTFPRHEQTTKQGYNAIPLEERDVEKNTSNGQSQANTSDDGQGSSSRPMKIRRKRKASKPPLPPKKNWKNIWIKWFIDCITIGAIFNTVAFLVVMGFLKGQPYKIPRLLRTETLNIIVNGYKIWPFANIIAHSVIPFERRIPFFAMVALCWNIYLSLVAARL
jgi:hypothetical protein